MANLELQMNPQMEQIHGEIRDTMRALANGFQKLDKIKDSSRQSKQLEDLTGKMRECKRLIKDFDREIKDEESRNRPEVNKQLNDEKQSMIKELNSYVALRKTYMSTLGNKRVELFDVGTGAGEAIADDNIPLASEMSNQELINAGMKTMDETDQAIERSKQVVHQTIEVGTQTATTLKGQTEQMGRIVNELDTIQFSIKKASQLVKEIGRQVATDKCIMLFLFLIVCGVIAIIIVKIVNPNNKSIRDIPGLAPPAPTRRRLLNDMHHVHCCVIVSGSLIFTVGIDINWGMSRDSAVPLALYEGSCIPGVARTPRRRKSSELELVMLLKRKAMIIYDQRK
ncbi:UNVERIFIED_CONTAM: putative plant SNARE 13 [Sesamum calycinum]|uniref:Plant SNARE 13 n=1 Tax=Sesamum calycinum TaxID=2727403 RepID=A0AAW2R7U2_9LAMI